MQELFFTILIIWVLWKIFGGTARASFRTYSYDSQQQRQKEEETARIHRQQTESSGKKNFNDKAGDYVDFEEIKD